MIQSNDLGKGRDVLTGGRKSEISLSLSLIYGGHQHSRIRNKILGPSPNQLPPQEIHLI